MSLTREKIEMWIKSDKGDVWECSLEDLQNLIKWYAPRDYKDETSTADGFDIKITFPSAPQILLSDKSITFQRRGNGKKEK